MGGCPVILWFFLKPPSHLHQNWCPPMGGHPHLKMKPPIWKTIPPLKPETPFHEMIPRRSTTNNNLKSSKILEKYVWRSSFLVNLEACRLIAGNFTIKWTPSHVFFDCILSSPHAPPMCWLKPPLLSNFEGGRGTALPCLQHLWETLNIVIYYWYMLVDICFVIYITNGQNKQTLLIYSFIWIMYSFQKTGAERC